MAPSRRYRQPSLRQIEAFKAVVEMGTVSRAAQALNMSQPAASKLLSNLEADLGLELFDRRRGLLSPTDRGFRFYKEVDRIFAGLNQISQAADSLRREERGQLAVGVMPTLSGPFITSVIRAFVAEHPGVHISVHSRSSQFLSGWMRSGELDVCVLAQRPEETHVLTETILALPEGVCEMVAAGLGVSLGHPIAAERVRDRVALVPFEPVKTMHYQMCQSRHGRDRRLICAFADKLREVAEAKTKELATRISAR